MTHDKSIVIGILARDCADSLERNIPQVEEICKAFADYHVIAYENDSKDGTDKMLKEWAERNNKVLAICETTNEITFPKKSKKIRNPGKSVHRISRMMKFRNRVLDEVRSRFNPDIFCFIDIDLKELSAASVIKAIDNAPEDWGGLFASAHRMMVNNDGTMEKAPFQFDSYAFMQEGIDPMQTGGWVISHRFHKITAWTMEEWVKNNEYYPCGSAFNGIGIYKWEAIKDLQYEVVQTEELKKKGTCFCEHVPFNIQVGKKGFRLYIARDMEVVYQYKKNNLLRKYRYWKTKWLVRFLLKFKGPYPITRYEESK